jgi:hypothetical protein
MKTDNTNLFIIALTILIVIIVYFGLDEIYKEIEKAGRVSWE